jgi:PBP1b-binding outer membrane lipoprotein LpoB
MRYLSALAATILLAGCGSQDADPAPEAAVEQAASAEEPALPDDEGLTDYEKAYKEKVRNKMRSSVVNSLMRENGVSKSEAECLAGLGFMTLSADKSDADARSKVEGCGVDPDKVLR